MASVNTSVPEFIASFRLVNDYFALDRWTPSDLATRLLLADRVAYETASHWRILVDYFANDAEGK